jgi:1-acyl-sn-glycerol-3-phosphate acyltransferase
MRFATDSDTARSYPRWVVRLARLVIAVFFRRIEVVGERHLEQLSGPVLFVANHNNGLVDPVLVIGLLPGRPRFLAKSTLWRNPALRPFLALGRVIPVHRRQDPGFDPERNEETFARCREVLAAGGSVALFPEGRSHSEPGRVELRTGAARIVAGGREEELAGTAIVPVGLLFDAGHRFRSAVLVRVGAPFRPREVVSGDGPETVRELTRRIAAALDEVTVSYPSWDEARLLERAVDIYLRERPALPERPGLAERHRWLRGFLEAYRALRTEGPERVEHLARAVARYDRLLEAFGVSDAQVAAAYPGPAVRRWALETLGLLGVLLPLAALGALLSYPPYRACGWLGSLVARDPDQPASYKLFGGLVLFPATWAMEAAVVWRAVGPSWALATVLAALLGTWAALGFRDRWRLLREEGRGYLLLRSSGRLREELVARRDAIRKELVRLVDEWRETTAARS